MNGRPVKRSLTLHGHRTSVSLEEAFWQELTGSGISPSPHHPEFRWLTPAEGHGARLLLQRLDDPVGEVRAHLDEDLDTPAAFAVIDEVAMRGHDVTEAAALLGIEL